jgi:hypothetical protein
MSTVYVNFSTLFLKQCEFPNDEQGVEKDIREKEKKNGSC